MSSTRTQVRGEPVPRVPARYHRMINSFVCGVPIKTHHRVSNVLRMSGSSFGSVPTRTEESQFLRGDVNGKFGRFGGKFVPETLMSPLRDLEDVFNFVLSDREFQEELTTALRDYVGRETPLYFAGRLTEHYKNKSQTTGGGPQIYLKREDLSHCGSHKINNALGQAMIARRLGCKRVVAATGAGQHGVATAAACAKLSLECTVFMGTTDIEKQSSNVLSMKLLGAQESYLEKLYEWFRALVFEIPNNQRRFLTTIATNPEAVVCPEMEGNWVEKTLEGVVLVVKFAGGDEVEDINYCDGGTCVVDHNMR